MYFSPSYSYETRSCISTGPFQFKGKGKTTHVFPDDGAETANPQEPDARNGVGEETFAREHGFADALGFVVFDNT